MAFSSYFCDDDAQHWNMAARVGNIGIHKNHERRAFMPMTIFRAAWIMREMHVCSLSFYKSRFSFVPDDQLIHKAFLRCSADIHERDAQFRLVIGPHVSRKD